MADFAPDLSSYPKPTQQNGLDQAAKATDMMGQFAVGQGIQQAIQPDGSIDRNVLAQVLKGSIAGSMQAPQALDQLERLRQAGYAADETGLRNLDTRFQHIAKAASYIAENPTKEGIMKGFGYLANPNSGAAKVGLGIPQISDAMKEYWDPRKNDWLAPAQVKAIAQRQVTQGLSASEATKLHLRQMVPFTSGAESGQLDAGTPMNPQELSVPTQPAPTTTTVDTRKTLPNPNGGNPIPNPTYNQPMAIGAVAPGMPPMARRPVRQFTEGAQVLSRSPPVDAATGRPIQTPQAAAANGPTPDFNSRFGAAYRGQGPIATGPVPGTAEAQKEVGQISGKNLANDLEASKNYNRQIFPLEQAIEGLQKLGSTGTGPGTQTINNLKSFVISNVPGAAEALKGTKDNVATFDKVNKYLVDFVNQTGNSGTNDKLAAAFSGNPSVKISNAAAQDVAKAALALQRMQRAQLAIALKSGVSKDDYSTFVSQNTLKLDPRAFGIDLMKPDQVKKVIGSLKGSSDDPKSEKGKFLYSLREAHDAGLLKER
jgi:hypothetical protein